MRCAPEELNSRYESDDARIITCKSCFRALQNGPFLILLRKSEIAPLQCNRQSPQPSDCSWSERIDFYHPDCLKCGQCGERLTAVDGRCWKYRKSSIVCMQCRIRLTHCARCRTRVAAGAWVHKFDQLPFHENCLICDQCGRRLQQGDRCGLWGDRLLCLEHFLSRSSWFETRDGDDRCWPTGENNDLEKCRNSLMGSTEVDGGKVIENASSDLPDTSNSKYMMREEKHSTISEDAALFGSHSNLKPIVMSRTDAFPMNDPCCPKDPEALMVAANTTIDCPSVTATEFGGHSLDSSVSSGCSNHSKSKRIRTSFTPDQLAILQANFDIEANPDGQELERIANIARLNKRVTQVWFQNARARKKKTECKSLSPSSIPSSLYGTSFYFQEHPTKLLDDVDSPITMACSSNESKQFCLHSADGPFDSSLAETQSQDSRTLQIGLSQAQTIMSSRQQFEQQQTISVPLSDSRNPDLKLNQLFNCVKFNSHRWPISVGKEFDVQGASSWRISTTEDTDARFPPSEPHGNSTKIIELPLHPTGLYPINFMQSIQSSEIVNFNDE